MSIELTLKDLYRTTVVERWNIVEVSRRQSVAEHQYLVALIAMRYCQIKDVETGVSTMVMKAALFHDSAEVLTGDVPTPTKELTGNRLDAFENRVRPLGKDLLVHPQRIDDIVSFCDKVEAFVWLHKYGVGSHAATVKDTIRAKLYRMDPDTAERLFEECLWVADTVLEDYI